MAALPAAVLAAGAAHAPALAPEEVLVVANANAKGSVPLARYYALARKILPKRIVVLRTTADVDATRKDFNDNIRDPIREYLRRHDRAGRIKCLALVWGVPVRVLGTELTAGQKALMKTHETISGRLQASLAVNLDLLRTVAVAFPAPRTKGLTPLGDLFRQGTSATPQRVEAFATLRGRYDKQVKLTAEAARKLKDGRKRRIALRQLAALELSTRGLRHLATHPPAEAMAGVPDKAALQRRIRSAEAGLMKLTAEKATPARAWRIVEFHRRLRGIVGAHEHCRQRARAIDTSEEDASVDSELAVLWEKDPPLRRWRTNPMNWRVRAAGVTPADAPKRIIMTARIDGPKARDALRIVKDSLATEKEGLSGKVYIDAGGKYPLYDKNLKMLHDLIRKRTKLTVVMDTRKQLFAVGSCPDAALYVGWYSLRNYVAAFTWVRGSVGWHVASLEAQHLRAATSNEWCAKLIQNGVAATLGAVNEPYLAAFPLPQDFFALLLTGRATVAECYWRTVPLVSWRLTLIADPLYNPYARLPHLSVYDLPPELAGRKRLPSEPPPAPPEVTTQPAGIP